MNTITVLPILSLQLLADGGGTASAGATGDNGAAAVPAGTGVKLADIKYGIQDDAAPASEVQTDNTHDLEAEFEKLIKGDYKAQYDARVQDIVRKRLEKPKEIVDKYNALIPTLEMLSKRYGVDANDIDALSRAIEDDTSYYEDEAMEKGVSVEQLKTLKKMERENSSLRRAMEEQQAQEAGAKLYAQWMNEAEETKKVYPSFDLEAEMDNPDFQALLQAKVGVKTAFEVLHKDEIIPAAMQYAAKTTESKLTKKIIANGARPVENGNFGTSASVVKSDVSQLTKADRQEIARRVSRGEKIRF